MRLTRLHSYTHTHTRKHWQQQLSHYRICCCIYHFLPLTICLGRRCFYGNRLFSLVLAVSHLWGLLFPGPVSLVYFSLARDLFELYCICFFPTTFVEIHSFRFGSAENNRNLLRCICCMRGGTQSWEAGVLSRSVKVLHSEYVCWSSSKCLL